MKAIRKIHTSLFVVVVALILSTCEKDKEVPISAAQVDITEVTPSYRNVQQQGSFVSNATITSAELHYTNDSTFGDYQTLALSIDKDKSYTAVITPLQQGATYYVRYKVANSYSSMLLLRIDTLHTLAYTLPKVTTDSVGSITASSFVGYGSLIDWGCDSLPKFGLCYSKSANPTIEGSHTVCAKKDNHFSGTAIGLDDGETYYIRAYAVNPMGIAYGEDIKFSTLRITKPTVVTSDVTDITVSSAVCGGKITSNGNSEITECGICYSKTAEPTIDDKTLVCKQDNAGEFSGTLTGLSEGTAYHVRAYAVNAKGVAYGDDYRFTTKSTTAPTITTTTVTDITVSSAVCGGKIISDGFSEITECGICYSTSAEPTIDVKKISYNGEDSVFDCKLTELQDGTTYYVCAYATNVKGTGYGEKRSFTTVSIRTPTVVTLEPTDITPSSAVCSGQITNNGNAEILVCGICYSTSANPTVNDKVVAADNMDNFSCTLTGLSEVTTYYVRAYATNSKGTAYGEERSFTTTKTTTVPTVTTNTVTDINVSSAMCGGKIVSDGYSEITACGICYSTSAEPTIDNKTVVCKQDDNGEFSTELTGLSKGTTYYVRAYATNSKGTAYGETVMFKTTDHAWVDLGLSVKWATCNVGASSPEEYGNYYAWGETVTKASYSWSTYQYGTSGNYIKYNETDEKTTLETEDDAAAVNWGGKWRMPTAAEWTELYKNCAWTWIDNCNGTGVAGFIVASKTNDNSIFLPAAGNHSSNGIKLAGYFGHYWSSSLGADGQLNAYIAYFGSYGVNSRLNCSRYAGCSVRAIHK